MISSELTVDGELTDVTGIATVAIGAVTVTRVPNVHTGTTATQALRRVPETWLDCESGDTVSRHAL